jgi:hypothetical protein
MTARTHATILLAVCGILVGFGLLTIVVSPGFFMSLLGAGIMTTGGAAAYLISSHRPDAIEHPSQTRWDANQLADFRSI